MISSASLLNALVFYSVVLAVVYPLRRSTSFVKNGGATVLLLVFALATVRLLLPLEIPFTRAVRSWAILGTIQRFFLAHPAIIQLLLAVWLAGAVVAVVRDGLILYRDHKVIRGFDITESERVRQIAERCGVKYPVLVSPDITIPFTVGTFRHRIYLPDTELRDREIELILAHEVQHIRNHDAQIKLLFWILSALQWWNPAIYMFRSEVDTLLEFRCDTKVTERMDAMEQTEYLQMLKTMAEQAIPGRRQRHALAVDESAAMGNPAIISTAVSRN